MLISAVLDSSAVLLNDVNRTTYTYAVMLPWFKIAYREVRDRLRHLGALQIREVSAAITVPAGKRLLVDGADVSTQPTNLLYPITLYVRDVGETDDDWVPVDRGDWDEKRVASDEFGPWTWRENLITFPPCSVIKEVCIDYIRNFATVTDETGAINSDDLEDFLSKRTAGLITKFVIKDGEKAEALDNLSSMAIELLVNGEAKRRQSKPVYRRKGIFRH